MFGIIGLCLLMFAGFILFIGLCLGDRCDWSDDGKFVFWLVVAGIVLICYQNSIEPPAVPPKP